MEAHGSGVGGFVQQMTGLVPDALAAKIMLRAGMDRLGALHLAIEVVRRGGTISLSGVYGGETEPLPMLTLFDKQIQLRMGQANVHRWVPEILPLLEEGDAFGVDRFHTHHLSLDEAPDGYEMFQKKEDGAVKVLLKP
jgi:threonine dehydrogenase-like Zn-dependent dehydrogenase